MKAMQSPSVSVFLRRGEFHKAAESLPTGQSIEDVAKGRRLQLNSVIPDLGGVDVFNSISLSLGAGVGGRHYNTYMPGELWGK